MSGDKNLLRIELWNNRKASDFMNYIKKEFLNAQMQGSFIMVDSIVMYMIQFGEIGTKGAKISGFDHAYANHM